MTRQAKTGHIGDGVHTVQRGQIGAGCVELGSHRNHAGVALGAEFFLLERRRQDAHPQRLAQDQPVAYAGIGIALDALGVHQAQGHQAIDGLHRIDGVAAGNGDARRLADRGTASQDLANGLGGEHVDGHAHQGQRHDGGAAHGVHIGDGVGGGDAAKVERIVDDGHEEVGGGNQRLLVVELVDSGVIGRLDAHQQLRRQRHGGGGLEDVRQHARRNLAAAAAAMRQGCQPGLGGCGGRLGGGGVHGARR